MSETLHHFMNLFVVNNMDHRSMYVVWETWNEICCHLVAIFNCIVDFFFIYIFSCVRQTNPSIAGHKRDTNALRSVSAQWPHREWTGPYFGHNKYLNDMESTRNECLAFVMGSVYNSCLTRKNNRWKHRFIVILFHFFFIVCWFDGRSAKAKAINFSE